MRQTNNRQTVVIDWVWHLIGCVQVWPTQFTAVVHGVSLNLNITKEHGVWHYDWPNNRFRADYVNHLIDGSTRWIVLTSLTFVF